MHDKKISENVTQIVRDDIFDEEAKIWQKF